MQGKIEAYLWYYLSPEQVTGVMRRQGEETVSHERIYQHIYADHRRGAACTSTCASAERSAGSDAEEYRAASA